MKSFTALITLIYLSVSAHAQINAKLMRYIDVSSTQITFVYGGDIWIAPKTGGQALQITNSPGEESYPKFSPDGSEIAYTASYNGNQDVYVMPAAGGIPTRITYASYPDRMVDWHPDGEKLLFASKRETGMPSVRQFFIVNKHGGLPKKIAIPYGELGSYSADGNKIAYITKITENYPFKRYRGGLTSDVIIFDLANNKAENITNNLANDGQPAWSGNSVYFLSDQGVNMRRNIWRYNTESKETKQITTFADFDIAYMSAGEKDLAFEVGGELYVLDLDTEKYETIEINVVSDLSVEIPKLINVGSSIQNMSAAPGGKRIVFEARGELFNVPVKEGFVVNMTRSSNAFDQNPVWSPDGKQVAYWSDKSGEYEIYLQNSTKDDAPKKLTNRNSGFGYNLYWSPDSKKIVFVDEKNDINIIDVATGAIKVADNYSWNIGHGGRFYYPISWSPDSKWITYTKGQDNSNDAIFMYNIAEAKVYKVTSGYFSDFNPVFSQDGKYLFYFTDRSFSAAYSGLNDGTWIYPNNTQLAVLSLTKDAPYLLNPKNDEVEAKKEDGEGEGDEDSDKKEKKKKDKDKSKGDENDKEEEKQDVEVKIDWDVLESRIAILSPKAGNLDNLMTFEGKIAYRRNPNTGQANGKPTLMYYDLEKREEKKIIDDVQSVKLSADGKDILVKSSGKYGIIKPEADQKIDKPIPTDGMMMQWNPKEEWRQIFNDTWRRHRDFFYDKDMQQVNWDELRERYGALIEDARTRWDVTHIQANLNAELSAGHTYAFGGDTENVQRVQTGYLGIDWELRDGKYAIKRIVKPARWDTEIRSPFDHSGVEVNVGDYIHAVNGIKLDPKKDPYASFDGFGGKTVSITVSKSGNEADAKSMIIKCLNQSEEQTLRYLEWIENNRKRIDKLSDGKLGYVYMSNTSSRGQLELVRMYYGQLDKKGFIIDERFNGGGQLADRFLELMQRPVVYNLYWRRGRHHGYPIKANEGPMGMLINGWAGSGGDALPWAFQELEAGPIVGERTLGILVGPATGHRLIDGGGITVPGARLYDNDGHWFWEGEGVKPDFPVWDDPNLLIEGRDPQMEKVVEEVLKLLEKNPARKTPPPAMEDRTAEGLNKK